MDTWVVSAFCAAVILGVYVHEYLFQFLWVYVGVELLCHMVFLPLPPQRKWRLRMGCSGLPLILSKNASLE